MTRKKGKAAISLIISLTIIIIVLILAIILKSSSEETPNPTIIPNSKLGGKITSVNDGYFSMVIENVSSGNDFGETFSENDVITVYTENSPSPENKLENCITNTKMISVGDKVEIVYYQHNTDLKEKKIFIADIFWEEEEYKKKVNTFFNIT